MISIRQAVLFLALLPLTVAAQTDTLIVKRHNQSRHSTMFGAGWANTYDTYLSPLEYKGADIAFMHETERPTHWPRISTQGMWRGHASTAQPAASNRDAYGGRIGYQHVWRYNLTAVQGTGTTAEARNFNLNIGGGIGGDIGCLYNTHVGNNPAQAYANVSLIASVAADYTFNVSWWKRHTRRNPFTLRAQLDAPFLGLMFSPRYGQSYYNIFYQGNYDRNIVVTWPGNAPTLRGHVTLDIPVSRYTLRIGYVFDALQATPNNLRQHTYLNNIMIGWSKRFAVL